MSKSNVNGPEGRETIGDPVTELLRVGAQQLIQQAVEAELAELLSQHGDRRTETGNAGVVRNGYSTRTRTADRPGSGNGANSEGPCQDRRSCDVPTALVPPYIRKTKSLKQRCRGCI